MSGFADIDLDVLRGWREQHNPELREDHQLPPLARLVRLGTSRPDASRPDASRPDASRPDANRTDTGQVETIHGPDVLVGRYHPQHGPVDVILRGLADHENYRLGAPHLHLMLDDDGVWRLRGISPGAQTVVDGHLVDHPSEPQELESGSEIRLGEVRYRFETSGLTLDEWEEAYARLLNRVDGPALFLCRRGGPCGPYVLLDPAGTAIGRSFPNRAMLAGDTRWEGRLQPDWNLAGLYEDERKFIAFEHAHIEQVHREPNDRTWQISPVAARRKTFVNRLEVINSTSLSLGDEIALGSVIFYLHEPGDDVTLERKALEPPAVIDWQEGSTPILDEASEPGESGQDVSRQGGGGE